MMGTHVFRAIARVLIALLVMAAALVVPTLTEVAEATYAGQNGAISYTVFVEGSGYSLRATDGANDWLIAQDHNFIRSDWSPDARRIAYDTQTEIFISNRDGTGVQQLTNSPNTLEFSPNWSPDGRRLVFSSGKHIEVMDTDGTGRTVLGPTTDEWFDAVLWHPSGNEILVEESFSGLWVMNADGTGRRQLTTDGYLPEYSPDGTKIAFSRGTPSVDPELWVMNADGTNEHRIAIRALGASWSPDGTKIAHLGLPIDRGLDSRGVYVTDADGGNRTLLVADGTAPDWGSFVPDPLITARGTTLSGTEGAALSNATVATFTDADQGGKASDYTASIQWGDGGSSAGTVTGTGGSYSVTGSHTYPKYGTYSAKVTITDTNNNRPDSATVTSTATIADAAITATGKGTIPSPSSFSGAVASFTDANPYGSADEFTATIDWGDGSSASVGTVAANGAGGYDVAGSHQYATTGPNSVSVSIASAGGSTASASSTILVYGVAQRGGFVIGDRNSAVGSKVMFWGSQWSRQNKLSGGPAPSTFKGFASSPSTFPACGQSWSTGGGNSPPPPPGPLPEYMAVVVTSRASQTGQAISGDTAHVVIVRVNPGYAPDPTFAGTGTVVGHVC